MWDKTRKSYTFPPSSSPLPFSSSMGTALSRSVPSSRSIKKLFRLPFVSRVMNRIDPLEIARTWNTIGKRPKESRSFLLLPLGSPPHYPTVTFPQLNRRVLRSWKKKRRRNSRVATTKDFLLRRERELKRVRLLRYSSKGTRHPISSGIRSTIQRFPSFNKLDRVRYEYALVARAYSWENIIGKRETAIDRFLFQLNIYVYICISNRLFELSVDDKSIESRYFDSFPVNKLDFP